MIRDRVELVDLKQEISHKHFCSGQTFVSPILYGSRSLRQLMA